MFPCLLVLLLAGLLLQETSGSENKALSAQKALPETQPAEPESTTEPDRPVPDDFTELMGIEPRIADQLRAAGITTFSQLAETSEGRLLDIIGGPRMFLDAWPAQARLAAAGDWQALRALQADL